MLLTSRPALLALICLGFLSANVDAVFFNTWAGFVTDITTNPLGVIAVLILKKLIVDKLILVGLGKRSIEDDLSASPAIAAIDPQALTSGDYEQLASRFDVNGCLARLVCQVVASQNETSKLDTAIIRYFGQEPNPDVTDDISKGSSIFHYAAFMGKLAKSPASCHLVFPNCKKSNEDVRKVADVVFELDL